MKNSATVLVLTLLAVLHASGGPLEDLSSPDQEVRDRGAEKLRSSYIVIPESRWQPVLDKIRKARTKADVLELLKPFQSGTEGSHAGGGTHSTSFRLDDEWLLIATFRNEGEVLLEARLVRGMKSAAATPSPHFTGKWVTYFINGQKSHEIHYKDGRYFGEFTAYREDGTRCYVQHYSEAGADGEDTGYYPSGKVSYRAQHEKGKPTGTWRWYDEKGMLTSTREYTSTGFFERVSRHEKIEFDELCEVLVGPQTTARAIAATMLGDSGDQRAVPMLIEALADESSHVGANYSDAGDATTRHRANKALKKLTGKDFGFVWNDPEEKRKDAIIRWKEWYQEEQK